MTWAAVQQKGTNQSGTGVFASNVTKGNLLLVDIFIESVGATVTAITDTLGTTYVPATGYGTLSGKGVSITYIGIAPSSGANTVTITSSAGVINNIISEVSENSSGPSRTVDALGVVATGSNATPTSNSITTTQAGDLMWGTIVNALDNYTGTGLTAGWTKGPDLTFNIIFDNVYSLADAASPGTYSFSLPYGGSDPWVVQIFAVGVALAAAPPAPLLGSLFVGPMGFGR